MVMAYRLNHSVSQTFSTSGRVDRTNGIIFGVSVITEGIAEGHDVSIDAKTLQQVKQCASTYSGGLKVKADHRSGIWAVAAYLRNFRIEGAQLKADLHILDSEENREKLLEMAETIPDTFGLSISFSGPFETIGQTIYARCDEIYSADIVTEPAANPNGLFAAKIDATKKEYMANKPEPKSDAPLGEADYDKFMKSCEAMMSSALKPIAEGHAKFASALDDYGARLSKLEAGHGTTVVVKHGEQQDGDGDTGLDAQLAKLKTELKAHVELQTQSLAKTIAAEFTKVIGAGPTVRAENATGNLPSDEKLDAKFEATVQMHFAKTNSKTQALSLAIKEEPKAYEAFLAAGRRINYNAPKAA